MIENKEYWGCDDESKSIQALEGETERTPEDTTGPLVLKEKLAVGVGNKFFLLVKDGTIELVICRRLLQKLYMTLRTLHALIH